ncbi:MAG: hypothetical protein GYB36_02695 [Alphaproteobacteria bacterium]|nr:hypothetical protein [Alphaproteobacteria bacterium]
MRTILLTAGLSTTLAIPTSALTADSFTTDIAEHGQAPAQFVYDALDEHALVIFDDGLHNLEAPWTFFRELIASEAFAMRARHVFIETWSVNDQPHIDAYLSTYPEDQTLLYPAMQNAAIHGWRYASYIDLLSAIHAFNENRAGDERLQVHAVSTPAYWGEIETPADFENYIGIAQSGRDGFMYSAIRRTLDNMSGEERGVFLTNTRHAYTGLRSRDGQLFWNTATYFAERYPDQTYSIRINAPFLIIEREAGDQSSPATGEGLEQIEYRWGRADDGRWDAAFATHQDMPVGIELTGTSFGASPYIGNLMLNAAPGQSMEDVYDGLIHLGPISEMQTARTFHEIYTPAYRAEVARRYRNAYTPDDLQTYIERNGVETLESFIELLAEPDPSAPSAQALSLPALDD